MGFHFGFEYGWGADPIADQLERFGFSNLPEKEVSKWQKIADSLLMVSLHSILPPSTIARGRDKLRKDAEKFLQKEGFMAPLKGAS